jgi:hypothetical protein
MHHAVPGYCVVFVIDFLIENQGDDNSMLSSPCSLESRLSIA